MSDACELIINDYICGALNVTELDEGLKSLFPAMPSCHVAAQNHLQNLFATDSINPSHVTEISQLISKVMKQIFPTLMRINFATLQILQSRT